eukprot:m.240524 g.240524  ORF g.240524 m.240524 type:complete len:65 (+) comp15329_c0_seq1:691-885(+)
MFNKWRKQAEFITPWRRLTAGKERTKRSISHTSNNVIQSSAQRTLKKNNSRSVTSTLIHNSTNN